MSDSVIAHELVIDWWIYKLLFAMPTCMTTRFIIKWCSHKQAAAELTNAQTYKQMGTTTQTDNIATYRIQTQNKRQQSKHINQKCTKKEIKTHAHALTATME